MSNIISLDVYVFQLANAVSVSESLKPNVNIVHDDVGVQHVIMLKLNLTITHLNFTIVTFYDTTNSVGLGIANFRS